MIKTMTPREFAAELEETLRAIKDPDTFILDDDVWLEDELWTLDSDKVYRPAGLLKLPVTYRIDGFEGKHSLALLTAFDEKSLKTGYISPVEVRDHQMLEHFLAGLHKDTLTLESGDVGCEMKSLKPYDVVQLEHLPKFFKLYKEAMTSGLADEESEHCVKRCFTPYTDRGK